MSLQRIKVVHIAEDLKVGGLERTFAYIVKNLDPLIFSVEVWCISRGGAIADELTNDGHRLRVLNLHDYYNPLNLIRLAGRLRREKVLILHSHGYFANTMGRIAALMAQTPIRFAHIQSSHWTEKEHSIRNYLIDRFLSQFTSRVIACSDTARRFQIERVRIDPKKIITVHNSIDVEKYANQASNAVPRTELGIEEDDLVIGSVGRLEKLKGHAVLLDAVSGLIGTFPNLKVLIIGEGEEGQRLQEKSSQLALETHLILAGARGDVERYLPILDVFVQPTTEREGLPLTVIEAMAARLPVVATKIGGVEEAVIHDKNGILVPPGESQKLAAAIARLLTDQKLRETMGEEGFRLCKEKFSVGKMLNAMTTLYLE
ncbi:glycosyltransferase, partial [Acidobacteria bacterium AH-259-L09]|nr:glycosyltransferase [Acidobacteria bacterium AH-259-L09]